MTRVGADVGGTFTDVVVSDGGRLTFTKVLSTPPAYDRAVVDAVQSLGGADEVVHGTTVATNAVLERRGARTAVVTTEGFRDVLELRRMRMPHLYDTFWAKPPPLVERRLRFEVAERVLADGTVRTPLDDADARALAAQLRDAASSRSRSACCTRISIPAHEQRLGAILREELPGIPVSLSSEILREQQEYERTATTVVNAYVRPLMARYVDELRRGLGEAELTIMQSSGGVMSAEAAAERPVYALESGPAAGVVAARALARGARPRERDRVRHGRDDGEGVADRERPRLAEPGVRGRRVALLRVAPAARPGELIRIPTIDIAEVGAGRRLDRLARRGRCPERRPAQRGSIAGACLLRARRQGADGHRRQRRARLHPGRPHRRRRHRDLARAAPRPRSAWIDALAARRSRPCERAR